jgi:hypothetical protein
MEGVSCCQPSCECTCSASAAADASHSVLAADALNGDSRESSGSPPSPNGNGSPKQLRNQRVPAAGEIRTQWKKWVRCPAPACSTGLTLMWRAACGMSLLACCSRSSSMASGRRSVLKPQHGQHAQVAIRDAPCAGHPWRYSKHQLAYHYTADHNILRRLVAFSSSPRDAPEVTVRAVARLLSVTCK